MKKRIITTVLAFACTVMCAFGLMACGGEKPAQIEHFYATKGVDMDNSYSGYTDIWLDTTAYGEKVDLSKYKLFLYYTDGSSKEVARNDAKLTVKYYTYALTAMEADKQEVDALPANKTRGNYVIEYTYDGNTALKASVSFCVDQAQSGNFTLSVQGGTTWQANGPCHNVNVLNPHAGKVTEEMEDISGDGTSLAPKKPENKNDTDGIYDLYLFKKSVFYGFSAEQRQNYVFLDNEWSKENGKDDPNIVRYSPEEKKYAPSSAGAWVLVALVQETYNYRNIVSAPEDITITAAAAVA